MYALTNSAEGDCTLSVPPDPGIAAAALGASASAALGTGESAAPATGESALSSTAPTEALHTFTLDSGSSRSFFRDSTTTLFPLCSKGEVPEVLIGCIRGARHQLSESFGSDLPVLRLHSDRGGEFSSDLLRAFCRTEGICQTFTLPGSPQQNGIAERRIGMVMDVARTSMIHAAAPHFLWPFAVQYIAHQINLQPRVSLPKTTPTQRWIGKVGDAPAFRVWGSRAFVGDTSADKLSSRAVPYIFLGFPPDTAGWQFYHPTSHRVLSSQDITFDESVSYYHLFPYCTASLPPPAALPSTRYSPGAARGAEPAGAGTGGVGTGGSEPERVEPGGVESGGAESGRAEPGGAEPGRLEPEGTAYGGAEPAHADSGGALGVPSWREPLSPTKLSAGGATGAGAAGGATGAGGAAGAGATGPAGGAAGAAGGAAGAGDSTSSGGAARAGAAGAAGGSARPAGGTTGAGAAGAAGGAAGSGAAGAAGGAAGTGSVGGIGDLGAEGTSFVSASQSQLQPATPLRGPSPYSRPTRGLTLRREPESRPVSLESRSASPVHIVRAGRVSRPRPPPVPGTHSMTLRPSTAPQRVPLLSPPASSLPAGPDAASDSLRAASPAVTRFLATAVIDPLIESTAASALVTELVLC
ncbi:unnamed protein product [Closterium sp. NIES-53]